MDDSAGGHLVSALARRIRNEDVLPVPDRCYCYRPVVTHVRIVV
jgi:acetyl esterase/lipase